MDEQQDKYCEQRRKSSCHNPPSAGLKSKREAIRSVSNSRDRTADAKKISLFRYLSSRRARQRLDDRVGKRAAELRHLASFFAWRRQQSRREWLVPFERER